MSRGFAVSICCAVALTVALSACSGSPRKVLGLDKKAPDEFSVVARPPLTIPPDFTLRPPDPGAPPPQVGTAEDMGRRALLGDQARPVQRQGLTEGERALLAKAGADAVLPEIRTIVNRETSILADEAQSFTDRLVFWREQEVPGTIVNAREESKRIREKQALGRPVTEGETPTIKRERKAIFEDLFN